MSEQLGILELVLGASFTVQAVMFILTLASVVSWFMILQRFLLLRRTDAELYTFEDRFWSGVDLAQIYREGNQTFGEAQ